MELNFRIREKEIHRIYKKYLISKKGKDYHKDENTVNLNSLGDSIINLVITKNGLLMSYNGISIDIEFNKIINIEKFKEYIVIENKVVDLVIPINNFRVVNDINEFLEQLREGLNSFRYGELQYENSGYNYSLKDKENLFQGNSLFRENEKLKTQKSVIVNINDKGKKKRKTIVIGSLVLAAIIIGSVGTLGYIDYKEYKEFNLANSNGSSSANSQRIGTMGFINGSNNNSNDNVLFTKNYDYKTIDATAKSYYRKSIDTVENSKSLFSLMNREEGQQFIANSYNGVNLKGSNEENAITYFTESVQNGLKAETMSAFQNDMEDSERGIAELSQMNQGPVYNSIETMALDTAALDNMMESCSGYSAKNVIAELDNELPQQAVLSYINKENLLAVPKGCTTDFYMGPIEMTSENQLYRTVLVNEVAISNESVMQSRLYEVYEDGTIKSIG